MRFRDNLLCLLVLVAGMAWVDNGRCDIHFAQLTDPLSLPGKHTLC
jgi:hypothetical protein